ncbi:MAG: permease prefix domain 1-containing protein [Carnobacterium sp.]|uniref:Permease prefix domain 1-containing protein n=1 Tax=Carnobacterium antarcticum TaxID=2126436 RepID=A0ABW4NPN2_9LACT|nr:MULTISPECIES: permease prefix domain 1-containing protein [unclassified Carnobacterium]ALV22001.1 hypothetical protein NY10_1396 [Carnobacterium sp. CP1]QQP69967.1 hypothetical protein JHE06_10265 [Carnobacterium sp. CS13]
MDTIVNYVDSIFINLPQTPEMFRLKEDMLLNMEEKYNQLKAENRSENEAIGTVLAEFGNIDEIIEAYNLETDDQDEENNHTVFLSHEEVEDYLSHRAKFSLGIAAGVFLCILAPAIMLLVQEVSSFLPFINHAAEDTLIIFSLIPLFLFIALAVGLFVIFGIKEQQYELTDRTISIDSTTRSELNSELKNFKPQFAKAIASGVVLCIIAPIVLLLSIVLLGYDNYWSVIFLLSFVAVGVFLFVFSGIIHATYHKLLAIGSYAPKKVAAEKLIDTVASIVFPLAAAVYVISGFLFNTWGTAWIIFPIVGILFAVFAAASESLGSLRRRK